MGECYVDTDNITIFEKDLLIAQRICAAITDTKRRNMAVASVIAAKISSAYFDSTAYAVDTQTGLHNIAPISEHFEISDLYVNDAYIDVRVYFSDEEMSVPKIHFDTGILPVAYMFVKLSSNLKEASVTGFLYPESVNRNNLNGDVYAVTMNDLCNFYDVEMRLHRQSILDDVDDVKIYELLEGSLSEQEIVDLFKALVVSKYSRMKLIKAVKAQSAFNFVSTPQAPVTVPSATVEAQELEYADPVESAAQELPVEEAEDDSDLSDEDLDSLFAAAEDGTEAQDDNFATEITPSGADVIESLDNEAQIAENSEQIETLFTGEQQGVPVAPKKKSGFLPLLILIALICGGGYFWYTHFMNPAPNEDYLTSQSEVADIGNDIDEEMEEQNNTEVQQADAMPVESVEETKTVVNKEESTSVAIPAIERNLDASVLISNLKIDWEVPEGYASNTSAKRYLVKLGKIIQLNLKTELLLLNKPPLSNKITVELKFNPSMNRFEVVGIQMSSGEKTVDDTILRTVESALSSGMSANTESFAKLQGNPVLIINL